MLVERLLPKARDRMVCIDVSATLLQAARVLDGACDLVLVCEADGRLAGVVTKTDVVRQTGRCVGANCTAPVANAMTRDVTSARAEHWLHDAWTAMKTRGFKNLPVVDASGLPIGVLNARDALQLLLQEVRQEEELLRDYVMNIGYR
ncbi:cyclic nucleotide-binding/CBS domain-containing protein [Phaeovulum sp.]|uniref:CBS domain-containing protein n=1 Tax=Phaeovulum sp. TaxID=2934796 RepID=UPI0039E4ABD2